jgi:hypothetical protein
MIQPSVRGGMFIGHVETCTEKCVSGWVWDPSNPALRETVDIYIDGQLVKSILASRPRPDLVSARIGDGNYGFLYTTETTVTNIPVEVKLARDHFPLRISDSRHAPVLRPDTDDFDPAQADPLSQEHSEFPPQDSMGLDGITSEDVQRLFDRKWYEITYAGLASDNWDPLQHYIEFGSKIGHEPNALFDLQWYERVVGNSLGPTSALEHYVSIGSKEGTWPNRLFWPEWYLKSNRINLEPAWTPLQHYLDIGCKLQYSTHPLFNPTWYANQHVYSLSFAGSPLAHFIRVGNKTGASPTPLFDPKWYLTSYPDVASSQLSPFEHFMQFGAYENRNPNAFFDTQWYLDQTSSANGQFENALIHYVTTGSRMGLDPSPRFSTTGYLKTYTDIAKANINPLEHYLRSGQREGRDPKGTTHGKASIASQLDIFSRFGGTEYGPIEKVLSYSGTSNKIDKTVSLCVHFHLFHVDVAKELVSFLKNIGDSFTLLISVQPKEATEYWSGYFRERLPNVEKCIVKAVPNIGRDVAPWVVAFAPEILKHDLFYHGHSKKSEYNTAFRDWRRYLLHNTMGSPSIVSQILNSFSKDEALGLIYPGYFSPLKAQPAWGGSRIKVFELLKRLKSQAPLVNCPDFPSGSFFWARVDYLRPLLTADLTYEEFDEEDAQIDGTLAHAIERSIGALDVVTGLKKSCVTVDVGYNLVEFWDTKRASKQPLDLSPVKITRRDQVLGRSERIAVYTCISGHFDELVAPLVIHPDVDYFLFTDSDEVPPYPFKSVSCRYHDIESRRSARFVKTNPVLLLDRYDIVVWIDANVVMKSGLGPFLQTLDDSQADIGVIHHTTRQSFVDEAEECARIGADDAEVLKEQAAHYIAAGIIPKDLIETNFIIARLSEPRTQTFFRLWWKEIANYSLRDQVSVNYALTRSEVVAVPLLEPGRSTRDDGRFIIFEHKVADRASLVNTIIHAGLPEF